MSDLATAVTPPAAPIDPIAAMSAQDRAHWRLTGEMPSSTGEASAPAGDTSSTRTADSSPAAPDVQAVSTDTTLPPASEPGTPKKHNAETRKAELKAEIEALARQRTDLQREIESLSQARRRPAAPDAETASSPVTQPNTLDAILNAPDPTVPMLSDREFFETYADATVSDLSRYVARYEIARAAMQTERTRTASARAESFTKAAEEAVKADPAYWDKVTPVAKVLVPLDHLKPGAKPEPLNYAAQEIFESANGPAILAHLAANPALMQELATSDPRHAIRTIARLAERLSTPSVPVSQPVVKTTTSAPAPGSTLGTRATTPTDEVAAALASGDVRRYKTAMNRREVAAS